MIRIIILLFSGPAARISGPRVPWVVGKKVSAREKFFSCHRAKSGAIRRCAFRRMPVCPNFQSPDRPTAGAVLLRVRGPWLAAGDSSAAFRSDGLRFVNAPSPRRADEDAFFPQKERNVFEAASQRGVRGWSRGVQGIAASADPLMRPGLAAPVSLAGSGQ
jgi:hypothetical protein